MAVRQQLPMQQTYFVAMKFPDSCQYGTNVSMCLGIVLNKDTSLASTGYA